MTISVIEANLTIKQNEKHVVATLEIPESPILTDIKIDILTISISALGADESAGDDGLGIHDKFVDLANVIARQMVSQAGKAAIRHQYDDDGLDVITEDVSITPVKSTRAKH